MNWEKQKFLLELELKKLEIEKEKLLKWIGFLQTVLLITASATISILYHSKETNKWIVAGGVISFLLLLDLLWNYRKVDKLKKEMEKLSKRLL